jgi:hypothetical protein
LGKSYQLAVSPTCCHYFLVELIVSLILNKLHL